MLTAVAGDTETSLFHSARRMHVCRLHARMIYVGSKAGVGRCAGRAECRQNRRRYTCQATENGSRKHCSKSQEHRLAFFDELPLETSGPPTTQLLLPLVELPLSISCRASKRSPLVLVTILGTGDRRAWVNGRLRVSIMG